MRGAWGGEEHREEKILERADRAEIAKEDEMSEIKEPIAKTILRRELDKLYPTARREIREKWWTRIAWLLPRNLVYWCAIRLIANASTDEWSNEHVPDITAMDALKRWDE